MALIACSECGKEISSQAAACPHCGHPLPGAAASATSEDTSPQTSAPGKKPFWPKGSGCLFFIVIPSICILIVLNPPSEPTAEERQRHYDERAREEAKEQEQRDWKVKNEWDGSVYQVEQWLKKSLRDPSSFEAVKWGRVKKIDSGYQVALTYRAKNGFGGSNVTNAVFLLSEEGVVIGNL